MQYEKSTALSLLKLLLFGLPTAALLLAATGCKKKGSKERVDPLAAQDEIVRIDARRQVEYPSAVKEGNEAFYLVAKQNPMGEPVKGAGWVCIDYTTVSFDGRFIGSSVAKSAKLYRQWSASTRYVPSLVKNDATTLGNELYNVIQKCHAGDSIVMGMSVKVGNATGMWKSRPNESVISSLVVTQVISDPKAEEEALIKAYLDEHSGFTPYDSVYKKVNEVGNGKVIPESGRVHLKYGAYFLDGTLLETNDETIADRYGYTLPNNRKQLLSISVKDDKTFISGLSGVCIGEKVGTKLEVITPSATAYKDKGRGSVRPYEPLRFELTIINYTER